MPKTIFIDKKKCIGCYSCVIACKLQNKMPPYLAQPPVGNPPGPSLMRVYEVGPVTDGDRVVYYFQPISCMHCLDAPCIKRCPCKALCKDGETGVTLVDRDKCIGCKACLSSCPFGAPQFHEKKAYLCNLCFDRVPLEGEEGNKTACEAICQARAIFVGDTEQISEMIGQKAAGVVKTTADYLLLRLQL